MKYKVIDAIHLVELEKEVNNHIESGWKLQGGISVARAKHSGGSYELRHYQALIKE
jgi:hypothetical protein